MPNVHPLPQHAPRPEEPALVPLVVVHLMLALSAGEKGWRVTVRIQDGWTGPVLSHWARGGSNSPCGAQKAISDLETAIEEALQSLQAF